jgi:hypothetical protein
MRWTYKRGIAVTLAVAMMALSTGRAQAALAPATLPGDAAVRGQNIETVQIFLEQKEVREHLAGLHLSPSEIESRLNNLSDQELQQVASKIQQEQPAGDGSGLVISILVIGILVLLFVYLMERV